MTALLRPGARIAVIAPAGRFSQERMALGMAWLRTQGWEPIAAPNLHATDHYHAGTAAQRGADLLWALGSRDIDAVWAVRGGAGCSHLLPQLEGAALHPKPLIGFSDVTALLVALDQRGWVAAGGALLHGPVVQTLAPAPPEGTLHPLAVDEASRMALCRLLQQGQPTPLVATWVAGIRPERSDAIRAPLSGGNLTVLASLCGTPWAWRARGCIALLEDIGEAPYRIDRSLTQLLQSGAFDGVAAVVLGDWSGCEATDADGRTYTAETIAIDRLRALGVPILRGAGSGHGVRNLVWPYGTPALLGANGITWPGQADTAA
jgi:muramoyltetrapeptide carboxypeptidase